MNPKPVVSSCRLVLTLLVALGALLLGNLASAATSAAPLAIRCPTNIVLWTCTSNVVFQYPNPSVSGGCTPVQVVCSPPQGTAFPIGVTTVTCRAFDGCQNADTCTFTITVREDTEPPVIQCPSNITVSACMSPTVACGKNVTFAPTAADNSGSVAVVCEPPSGSFFLCGDTVVTCTALDRCGNKDQCRFMVTVVPGQPPTIQCPQEQLLTTCSNTAVLSYPFPIVTPPGTPVTCVPPIGTPVPLGVIGVVCTAANECGSVSCEFQVVVRPVPPPSIQCPTTTLTFTVPCGSNCVPVFYPDPVVVNGTLVGCNPPSGTCLGVGPHLVTCRATNRCGDVAGCEFPINVVQGQGEPPHILCPNDLVITTCSNCVRFTSTTFPRPVVVNGVLEGCKPALDTCFPIGTTVVTCVATNPCGRAECSFRITVRPVPPPTIQCPTETLTFTVPCGSNCVPVFYPDPVVVNGTLIGCSPPSGTCLPVGLHGVVCRASNDCGVVVGCQFPIQVVQGPGQPPHILCPNDLTLTTCSNCVIVPATLYPTPTVVNGNLAGCQPPPGTCFPLGSTVVTCLATNPCSKAECSFTITVRPVPPPVIQCPTNVPTFEVRCGSNCVPVFYPLPVVVNGSLERCIPPPGTCLPVGLHAVVCRATNICGVSVSCEFTVRVQPGDSQPPHILCPSNILAWTCGTNGVVVNYPPPTVFPGSDPTPTVSCVPPSGSLFPLGVTVVICTVKDDCGNESKCEFLVAVRRDVSPPILRCPSNIVVCVPANASGREVDYTVGVSDDADPAPSLECQPPSGSFFPLGTTLVICRAKDRCGNESKCSFTVTVLPDRAPVLSITKDHGIITVCWTKVCRCFKLQATRSLSRPIVWIDVDLEPADHGTEECVQLPVSGGMRFFRLIACDQPTAPVYGVKSSGITAAQGGLLAAALDLSRDQVHFDNGAMLFLDPLNFQAIPTQPIQDPAIIERLKSGSQDNQGDLAFEGINFEKLKGLRTVPGDAAIDFCKRALEQAKLLPENGEPSANHSMFEAVDAAGRSMIDSMPIDTHVNFHFNLGGIPLIGPGAKLSLALGPDGKPTALHFATRQLEPIQEIPILQQDEAARRCARLYPNLQPSGAPRLFYFAPSLGLPAVQKVIPCYECGGEAIVDSQQVSLLRSMIPATDDPALVPHVVLHAESQGNAILARAIVDGGTPPYSYQWLSSSTDLSTTPPEAAGVQYVVVPRGAGTNETVRVIVTDANGVQVQDASTVPILGGPDTTPGFFAAVGGVNDYGTERAVSNMGAAQQSGFNSRFDSEAITRRFNWTGLNAWERDFKEGGTGLDNFYADNADIVFYIGHGYGGGFTFESTKDDGTLYYTDAAGAWGDIDLEWLALLSCQVLQANYGGQAWWQRWGPSFDGLHILLGFETNAHDWPAFGGTFADWTLGRHIGPLTLPPMPVRASWFLAKSEQQPAADIAVAMGVVGPGGIANYNDYFWGKGPVGPDVRGGDIHGYWRVTFQ